MSNMVVARYRNGEVVKGFTMNFDLHGDHCHVTPQTNRYGEGTRVEYDELKALFFVKNLSGNPLHLERKDFKHASEYGRRVRLVFEDGEELMGLMLPPTADQSGMMAYPADPESNNERFFAPYSALERLVFLGPPSGHFTKASPNAWEEPFEGKPIEVTEDYEA